MSESTSAALTGGQGGDGAPAPAVAATPAAPASTQLATPPAQPPNAAAPSWLPTADESTTAYLQNKGWTDPAQVLDGYRNLEKLLGADKAGNAVVMPKPDAPQAELDAFYNRLGRPSDPKGYTIEVPEGGDKQFAEAAATQFHKLGMTKAQGEALAKWNNELAAAQAQAVQQQKAQAFQADDATLKQEWGGAYTQNLAAAQAAVRGLGLDTATIDKMADALGHKATMQLLHKIGAKAMEPEFIDGKPGGFNDVPTPAQAKEKIKALTQDKEFVKRLTNKDAAASAEWSKLHGWAYPQS